MIPSATLTGATANHPMAGVGAVAFAATGTFQRSRFGMDYLLAPPIVGDAVTLNFNGEFLAPESGPAESES